MDTGKHQTVAEWLADYDREEMIMDMNQFATSESNDLKAIDYKGKNFKVRISVVESRHYDAKKDQPASDKGVLSFDGREKTLVLNKTNTRILISAYGADSEGWAGKEIGLSTQETELGEGWVVTPLNVAPPDFDDAIDF